MMQLHHNCVNARKLTWAVFVLPSNRAADELVHISFSMSSLPAFPFSSCCWNRRVFFLPDFLSLFVASCIGKERERAGMFQIQRACEKKDTLWDMNGEQVVRVCQWMCSCLSLRGIYWTSQVWTYACMQTVHCCFHVLLVWSARVLCFPLVWSGTSCACFPPLWVQAPPLIACTCVSMAPPLSSNEAPALVLVLLSQCQRPSFVSLTWSSACAYFERSHCCWTSCEAGWLESSWVESDGWEADQARALVAGDVSVYHTDEPLLHEQKLPSPQR